MITNDKKLQIFENFFSDPNLKKAKPKPVRDPNTKSPSSEGFHQNGFDSDGEGDVDPTTSNIAFGTSTGTWVGGNSVPTNGNFVQQENAYVVEYLEYVYSNNATIINWFRLQMGRLFMKNKLKEGVIKYQSVDSFFTDVHNAVMELGLDPTSVEFYTDAMQDAQNNGQQALLEILASRKNTLLRELKLLKDNKKIQYVEEKDVVNFFEKSKIPERYLKMTWMRNYVRVIPKEVLDKKKAFDDNESFDNYVVLHFDKNNDASEMTVKEKQKAKDPILFGLIAGSRRLYFVGDWVDEYCDLTLDKFIKTLEQKKVKELNKASIKKEILNTKE